MSRPHWDSLGRASGCSRPLATPLQLTLRLLPPVRMHVLSSSRACIRPPSHNRVVTAWPRSMCSCPPRSAPRRRLPPLSACSPSGLMRACGGACLPRLLPPTVLSSTPRPNSVHVPSWRLFPRVLVVWSPQSSLWSYAAACAYLMLSPTCGALVATVCWTPTRGMQACARQVATGPDVTTLPATLLLRGPTGPACSQRLKSPTSFSPNALMKCAWLLAGLLMCTCLLGTGLPPHSTWPSLAPRGPRPLPLLARSHWRPRRPMLRSRPPT